MKESKEMGLLWGEAQAKAPRTRFVALCPSWDEEDKKGSTASTDVGQ